MTEKFEMMGASAARIEALQAWGVMGVPPPEPAVPALVPPAPSPPLPPAGAPPVVAVPAEPPVVLVPALPPVPLVPPEPAGADWSPPQATTARTGAKNDTVRVKARLMRLLVMFISSYVKILSNLGDF